MKNPTVRLGKPERAEAFDIYQVEGIDVFAAKSIKPLPNRDIRILFRKILWMKNFIVEGIKIDY